MALKCEIFLDGKNTKIRTLEDISFNIHGKIYTVPAGFVSDGMSIPVFFHRILAPCIDGRTLRAAIIHDWLYSAGICTRKQADDLFYKLMIEDGFPKWKSFCCWLGVRIGGSSHFNS